MSLDGSLDGANGSSVLWYGDEQIPSNYRDIQTSDSRWIKYGQRHLYDVPANDEEVLGRKLKRGEVVHHINGKRGDNRKANLCVMKWDDRTLGVFQAP